MSQISDTSEVIITSDTSSEHWSAAVWDPRTGSILSNYKSAGAFTHRTLQLLSDSYIVGADVTKPRIHVYPLNSNSPVPNLRLSCPGKVTALSCTPNGFYIVAAISEKLYLWQVCNGRLLKSLSPHHQTVSCLSFSKDGSIFASGGEDSLIFVWSLFRVLNEELPTPLHEFSHHSLPVKDLQFGHAGSLGRLFSVSLDRTCNVYQPTSGLLLLSLVFNVPLTTVCVNTRESDLFVGCVDGDVYQFNLHEPPRGIVHHMQVRNDENSPDEMMIFRGNKSTVLTLSISIDSRYLLTGSANGQVHVWDVATRQILRTINHKGPVTAAFFARNYGNFHVSNLEPSVKLSSLQRIADNTGKESTIEVIDKDRTMKDILNFDSYVVDRADSSSQKLQEMKQTIDRMNKINHSIYEYSVKRILGQELPMDES